MSCPYCESGDWHYNECDGDLIEIKGNYVVIRFIAECEDCERIFYCDGTFERDGGYECLPMKEEE